MTLSRRDCQCQCWRRPRLLMQQNVRRHASDRHDVRVLAQIVQVRVRVRPGMVAAVGGIQGTGRAARVGWQETVRPAANTCGYVGPPPTSTAWPHATRAAPPSRFCLAHTPWPAVCGSPSTHPPHARSPRRRAATWQSRGARGRPPCAMGSPHSPPHPQWPPARASNAPRPRAHWWRRGARP